MTASQAKISAVIELMGSAKCAALAMGVTERSVDRYLDGTRELKGPALAAARAVIRNPENYEYIRKTTKVNKRRTP